MNALVRKEIRLLLPSWGVAMLLAVTQGFVQSNNDYMPSLLFFGFTLMALTSIGREVSLNTFSGLLAQPAERSRIWATKLSVLGMAFVIVLGVWLAAFAFAYLKTYARLGPDVDFEDNSHYIAAAVCLMAVAAFAGGLWTTLLLRQVASAFWLTLMVPVALAAAAGIFIYNYLSYYWFLAGLCAVIGVYALAGFLWARRLFLHAQDVGWSGGVIALPEWKFLSATGNNDRARAHKPLLALVKKEIQLQQGVLTGAAALLVLNVATIGVRFVHKFPPDSSGAMLTGIWWIPWLVLPALLGCIAVAEERKLGVMEGQLCLPVSRGKQFAVKAGVTLGLGILLGGVLPILLEMIATALGAPNSTIPSHSDDLLMMSGFTTAFSLWLALLTLLASSLTKNFLQAITGGLVIFLLLGVFIPTGLAGLMSNFVPIPLLTVIFTGPIFIVTLLALSCLNFTNFREGWPLWRRNLLGLALALALISAGSAATYNRAWEVFYPAEPAHGEAKLSLANPPELRTEANENLIARLPDGRIWFDSVASRMSVATPLNMSEILWRMIDPWPRSAGPRRYISGSNWAEGSARHVAEQIELNHTYIFLNGYAESIGIRADGTLWISGTSNQKVWTADKLDQFGADSDWQEFARGHGVTSALLVKKDGTLWRWGTNRFDLAQWPAKWPGLRAFQPYRIGAETNWAAIYSVDGTMARKTDGTAWWIMGHASNGSDEVVRATNYDDILTQKHFRSAPGGRGVYIKDDGTLWIFGRQDVKGREYEFRVAQCSRNADWVDAARTWNWQVGLKTDGTLWQFHPENIERGLLDDPTRLGIHNDWVAVTAVGDSIVSLAADGGLWLWPDPYGYFGSPLLLKLPKQPQFIGNIFDGTGR